MGAGLDSPMYYKRDYKHDNIIHIHDDDLPEKITDESVGITNGKYNMQFLKDFP